MTDRRTFLALLFAVLAPAALAAHEEAVAIKDPLTVPVAVKLSDAQLRKAVRATLLNRGWKLDHEKPGTLEAAYHRSDAHGTYAARVGVTYDAQQIVVRYLSSDGLAYDASARTIKPAYNGWMDNLAKDFPVYLSLVTSD